MKEQFVITIRAEDRSGLLHLVTGVVEKRLLKIGSLSYAQTDIHGIVLITLEISGEESVLTQVAFKLENIVEVLAVEVSRLDQTICLRAAYFKLSKNFLESPKAIAMSKYDTTIVKIEPDAIWLAKYGSDETILKLYNDLDGACLLGFSQSGLISDSKLMSEDQSSVINRLAA